MVLVVLRTTISPVIANNRVTATEVESMIFESSDRCAKGDCILFASRVCAVMRLGRIGPAVFIEVGSRHKAGFRNGDQRQREAALRDGDVVLQEGEVYGQRTLMEDVKLIFAGREVGD